MPVVAATHLLNLPIILPLFTTKFKVPVAVGLVPNTSVLEPVVISPKDISSIDTIKFEVGVPSVRPPPKLTDNLARGDTSEPLPV